MIIPQWNAEVDWPLAWSARKYTLLVAMLRNTRGIAALGSGDVWRFWRWEELRLLQCCSMLSYHLSRDMDGHFVAIKNKFLYYLTISSFGVSRLTFLQQFIIQGELILSQHTTEKRNQSKIRPA